MNNEYAIPSSLTKSVSKVSEYVRKIDLNGYCQIEGDLRDCLNDDDIKSMLLNTIKTYFEQRIEHETDISDIEDKWGAIDRLDRAYYFDNESFSLTLFEVMNFVLKDIHPDTNK